MVTNWQKNWQKEKKNKEPRRVLAIAISILGVGAMLSPIPVGSKLAIGLSGTGVCAFQILDIKARKRRLEQFESREAQKLEDLWAEYQAKQKQLEADLLLVEAAEAEIASRRRIAEIEIKQAKEANLAQLERDQDKLLLELEAEERKRRHALEKTLEEERERILRQLQKETEEKKKIISALDQEQEQKRSALELELEQYRAFLTENLVELEAEKERKTREAESAIAQERKNWEKEMEEAEKALADQFVASRDQMLQELQELQGQLEQQSKLQYQQWLVPHCQEMDSRLKEIEALKGTVQMLREELAQSRDIRLSGLDGTPEGDTADKILIWLKQNGQHCDYHSALIAPDGSFILNFLPWTAGARTERAIKGLLTWMIPKFGLREPPLFQPNGQARAWTLTMFPIRSGRVPDMGMTRLNDFYSRDREEIGNLETGTTFRDLESDIREGVQKQLNYELQVNEMMAFRPPVPLPRPSSYQISELEMATCQWFYSWRGLATNGEEPNITTREGLLRYVYGVREGRATSSYDPILCESLGDRIRRILGMLKLEAVELEASDENQD